jgi:hypothetical protein
MVVRLKDLQVFYSCCYATAVQRRNEIIRYFKTPSKKIWLEHLAKYEGLTVAEVKFILKIR